MNPYDRNKVRLIVFECSNVFANALMSGKSLQEAEILRLQKFNEFWPELEI